jgi:hypothetical protein
MVVTFMYYRECPSHELALEQLKTILHEEGLQAEIRIIEVQTVEQARELHFVGSPTILVDGKDIAPVPEDAVYGLACRAYMKEDGRISPLPPHAAVREALQNVN